MNNYLLRGLVIASFAWATTVYATESVQRGTGIPVGFETKVTREDRLLTCLRFEAGQLDSVIRDGIRLYGSVENFYSLIHEIQCPPNAPSPIYAGINIAPAVDGYNQMFKDLARLAPEVRTRLLNRPTSGRRKETILDLIDRRMSLATGSEVLEYYQSTRVKFIELGAKKVSEMTPEELAVYE